MDLNGNKSPDFFEHAMVIVGTYLLLLHYFNSAAFTEYNTKHTCLIHLSARPTYSNGFQALNTCVIERISNTAKPLLFVLSILEGRGPSTFPSTSGPARLLFRFATCYSTPSPRMM